MSDPGSTTPPTHAAKLSGPSSGSLAFLVHSPDTVERNLPPDVDNKPLARQKRRRTSPEDQKILEAEYQRNNKPDKTARLEIVKRVALGEKEVQIWFQNRRQNTRRKSKPIEPHEIQSHLHSSPLDLTTEFSSSEPNSDEIDQVEQEQLGGEAVAAQNNQCDHRESPDKSSATGVEASPKENAPSSTEDLDNETQRIITTAEPHADQTPPNGDAVTELGGSQSLPSSQDSQRQGIGYLANRRSQSFARTHEEAALEKLGSAPSSQEQALARTLKKSSSFVRLSMTEDGKARVITSEDSPSPPRSQPIPGHAAERSEGLRRSYSAAALNEKLQEARSPQGLQRSFSGRSRDSRAWEFWCDSGARNSLTEKANQEGSGSAADAIGLIRSTSRGALKLNPNKRNAPLLPQSSAKRVKIDGKGTHRPPLARSSSSQGRLQGRPAAVARSPLKKSQSVRSKGTDEDGFEIPQTESDKENWEPGVPGVSSRRTKPSAGQQPSQPRRRVLAESTNIPSTSTSLGALMDREKGLKATPQRRLQGKVTSNPEDDEEIRAFMGGAGGHSQRTSVSSGEELGCVEGLLKLSQGNWR